MHLSETILRALAKYEATIEQQSNILNEVLEIVKELKNGQGKSRSEEFGFLSEVFPIPSMERFQEVDERLYIDQKLEKLLVIIIIFSFFLVYFFFFRYIYKLIYE